MSSAAAETLRIPNSIWEQMRDDVDRRAPEEACGILAGCGREVQAIYPITNQLHSRLRYLMEPHEQLKAFQLIEAQGWELLAIYHSHPRGPEGPSATDIAEAYYPEAIYLIWSRSQAAWRCRGFRIEKELAHPIELQITGRE